MNEQHIQVICFQCFERCIDGRNHMLRRCVVAFDAVLRAVRRDQLDAAFADNLHAIAQSWLQGQGFAKQSLSCVCAVNICVVKGSDT